jgi:hemolysin activation/secretion protein
MYARRLSTNCLCIFVLSLILFAQHASAQTGPRIIDNGRLDQAPSSTDLPSGAAVAPNAAKAVAPADIAHRKLVLREVRVIGARVIPATVLAATWQKMIGQTITVQDAYGIADAIGAAYADAGVALYQAQVPAQDFADGIVLIRVTEGYVSDVVIQGDVKDGDLSTLKVYAARIVADRPLRRSRLEREILLMNQLFGVKVGSKFVPLPGQPGAVRLVLTIQRQRFEGLAGVNNQGVSTLGNTEMYVGAAVNSVLQEGDRTEFVFGFPPNFSHYQYYGLTHIAPLGNNGATLTVNLGDLVTHPVGDLLSGNAVLGGLTVSYPIILSTRESLSVSGAFDMLNANDAELGTTIVNERTRALRAGIAYAREDDWKGTSSVGFTFSEGVDILGAQRGSAVYGGPDFTKFNLRLARDQKLPWDLVARVRVAGQYATTRLPASEEFIYGITDYGQAFTGNPLYGDRGVEAYAELAHGLPWVNVQHWVSGTELFAYADRGTIWNVSTPFAVATDHAASAGFGIRTKLLDKLTVQVAAADAIMQPVSVPAASRWGVVFTLVGAF